MTRSSQNRLVVVLTYLLVLAALSAAVWRVSYGAALDQLARRGQAELALASDGLLAEFERYRELAVLLADHPTLAPVLQNQRTTRAAAALLRQVADKTAALDIAVVDAGGAELSTASGTLGPDHAGALYFERAMDGALGVDHMQSGRYGKRTFVFAAPIFSDAGPVRGAILVSFNGEAVEAAWRGDRPALFFTDEAGVVFLSNRTELLLRGRYAQDPAPFIGFTSQLIGDSEVWHLDGQRYLPASALHLELPLPVIDLIGEALIDVAPARQLARLQAMVVLALGLAFGGMLFFAMERRRTLIRANARLEDRVALRTRELEQANTDLRHEVATRSAAEAQLVEAQAELVQAGKLSALGQMSAGISHELNQPLMAIRSFAENAQAYLERDKPEVAAQNLSRIAELSRRMGRIIQNLRAFARQESAPLSDVDLLGVMDAVIEISEPKAREAGVTLDWTPPPEALKVRGGEVRLQQVLVNLVSNAIDALEDAQEKRVEVSYALAGSRVEVMVRDTGPGITEPEKIFDPFYSTKTVGQGDGMGLGLSISYGLVQSFGGAIQGRNHPDGGAIFTIELDLAQAAEAA